LRVGRQQPQDGFRRNGFAAAGLSHQRHTFPAPDGETHPVDYPRQSFVEMEMDDEVLDFEERLVLFEARGPKPGARQFPALHCSISTSKTSRRPSPSRLNPSTVRKMASPGKVAAHHPPGR